MIEEITIKFGTELKPTQYSWKSQLYIIHFEFQNADFVLNTNAVTSF